MGEAKVKHIRQTTQFSCVAASVCSALNAIGKECSETDVNKVLGAGPMRGARWEEAMGAIQYFGGRGTLVIPATIAMVKEWTDQGIPVLIGWNPEGRPWSHASVVFKVDDDHTVHVMDPNIPDPNETVRIVPKADFYRKWVEAASETLIVRRPALAVPLEVDPQGRQLVASTRTASANKVADRWMGGDE